MLQGIASSAQTGHGGGGSAGSSTAPSTDTDFPVNAEHSYSLGGSTSTNSTFGSDGDSMPESPLSLDDGNLRDFHFSFYLSFLL